MTMGCTGMFTYLAVIVCSFGLGGLGTLAGQTDISNPTEVFRLYDNAKLIDYTVYYHTLFVFQKPNGENFTKGGGLNTLRQAVPHDSSIVLPFYQELEYHFKRVEAGRDHTIALGYDGIVYAWVCYYSCVTMLSIGRLTILSNSKRLH